MGGKYDDIINLPHRVSKMRQPMSMLERAAQFSPFQALTGYGAAIKETARLIDEKSELGEEDLSALNVKLRILTDHLEESPEVSFVCFQPDERKAGGSYVSVTGWRTSRSSFAWTYSRNTTIRGTGGSWRRCLPM